MDGCVEEMQGAHSVKEHINVDSSPNFARIDALYPDLQLGKNLQTSRHQILKSRDLGKYTNSGVVRIFSSTSKELLKHIRQYLDTEFNGEDGPLWSITRKITIYHDDDALDNGVTLIDLPGLDVSNSARRSASDTVVAESIDHVFVVGDIGRVATNKTVLNPMYQNLQERAQGGNRLSQSFVTIIVSKIDVIALLPKLKENISPHLDGTGFDELLEQDQYLSAKFHDLSQKVQVMQASSSKRKRNSKPKQNDQSNIESLRTDRDRTREEWKEVRNRLVDTAIAGREAYVKAKLQKQFADEHARIQKQLMERFEGYEDRNGAGTFSMHNILSLRQLTSFRISADHIRFFICIPKVVWPFIR